MAPIPPTIPHPHPIYDLFQPAATCMPIYLPSIKLGGGQGQAPRVHCLVNNTDTGDTDTRDTDTGDTDTRVIDAGDSQIHEIRVHRYRRYS